MPGAVGVAGGTDEVDGLGQAGVGVISLEGVDGAEVVEARRAEYSARCGCRKTPTPGVRGSPVVRRRSRWRASRYSSPASRTARVEPSPVTRSYSRSASRALRVEWTEDRVEPCSHSQFQPPSSIAWSTNQAAFARMSRPSQRPLRRVMALMQTSTSPSQKGRSSYSQRVPRSNRSAVSPSARAGTPHSRREFSDQVVAVHGWPSRKARGSSGPGYPAEPGTGKNAPPDHCPSGSWRSSSRSPNPSRAVRSRVVSYTSAEAPARSRCTCQATAGSESSNQARTACRVVPVGRTGSRRPRGGDHGRGHRPSRTCVVLCCSVQP